MPRRVLCWSKSAKKKIFIFKSDIRNYIAYYQNEHFFQFFFNNNNNNNKEATYDT